MKNFQLNLILWHVLSFSIRTLTIFKKLAEILTCLKVLAQNLTRFEKLVSKCEAAQKTWLKICSFFKKNYQNENLRESTKVTIFSFSRCKMTQRNWFFESKFFGNFWFSTKKFSFRIWRIVKFSIQSLRVLKKLIRNLTHSRNFASKFDELLLPRMLFFQEAAKTLYLTF